MTRRKPSWAAAVRNEEPHKNDGNLAESPTERLDELTDSKQDSPIDRNYNHGNNEDDDDDEGNGDNNGNASNVSYNVVENHNLENCSNENCGNEKNGSFTSSMGKCPFMVSSELSVDSPAPSRCSEATAAARRVLSKSQLRDYREAFRIFDKDGDGSITTHELDNVMRSLGQHAMADELIQMLAEIDSDGDGTVSFNEFVDILEKMSEESCESSAEDEERELRDAFRVFDKHNRGYITASDLRAVLRCLGEDLREDEIEDMIKEVDVDGDGRIDFYEFVNALGEPENSCDEDEDDDDGFAQTPQLDSDQPTPTKSPVVKTVVTSPIDSPKNFNSTSNFSQQQPSTSKIDWSARSSANESPVPGSSKDTSPNLSNSMAGPSKEQTSSPESKSPIRSTARQQRSSRPSSRPNSRSVSPDPNFSQKPMVNSIYERRRSPSVIDPLPGTSSLQVNLAQDRSRRSSRAGLISEEVALLSKASFRESYNAMVKPNQKSNADSQASESRSPFTLGISDITTLRALVGQIDDIKATDEHKFQEQLGRNSTLAEASFDLGDSDDIDNYFKIGNDQIIDDISDPIDVDASVLNYQPIPGFEMSAFFLAKDNLDLAASSNT